jgi:hypothetical protein
MDSPKTSRKRTRTRKPKVEAKPENKYAPKPKIGANRPKNFVTSVNLNKLQVNNTNVNTDV